MSNKALTWAFEAKIDNVGAKFVLVALADHASDHAGEDWTCWPGLERLMEFTSMPTRTVERHLSWLVAEGWITREAPRDRRGRVKARIYRLVRARAIQVSDVVGETVFCPPAKLAGGETSCPPAKTDASTRQNEAHHPPMVAGGYKDEPPIEPSVTPTPGAREPLDEAFQALCGAYPISGMDNTDVPAARTGFASAVETVGDPWRLVLAARSFASAPETQRRSFAAPGLHVWLSRQSYLGRLPPSAVDAVELVERAGFVPADFRRAFVDQWGEGAARSYLDPCGWGADRMLLARTTAQEAWLRKRGYRVERQLAAGKVG
jgi:hypothetical protein